MFHISDLVPARSDKCLMSRHVFTPEENARGIITGFQGDTGFGIAVQSQSDKTYRLFQCALKDCMRIHKHLRLNGVLVV
jgi:hypothetical protein